MQIHRGVTGTMPYAETGSGRPLAVFGGLAPVTGVDGDGLIKPMLAPLGRLRESRRVLLFNRRPGLPRGMTMAELAAEHAAALQALAGEPVDLIGTSTGGSIAQQVAADHPDVVDRLALVSTACRLGPTGRAMQAEVGRLLRAGHPRRAAAVAAGSMVPRWCGRNLARGAAALLASHLIPTDADGADLATTIEAEDGFDLAGCPMITAPTLVLAGARDRFYAPELFAETARLIPGARLELVIGKGHITVLSDRGARTALADFLAA